MPVQPQFRCEMPSAPKSIYARLSLHARRLTVRILFILIGLAGFGFGFVAISRQISGYKCRTGKPRSVSVVWERSGDGGGNGNRLAEGDQTRYKVMGFVGIQTGFASAGRRKSLRQTWMPSDQQGLQRYGSFFSYI